MRSSSGAICIATSAQKHDVDNRISLRDYYRVADNLLKQADIFREEKNVTDLYIMLLRFSSLIAETIPCHQDYQVLLRRERNSFRKKLLNALTELEALKPLVQKWLEELNRKYTHQVNREDRVHQNFSADSSLEWPPTKNQTPTIYDTRQAYRSVGRNGKCQGSWNQQDKISHSSRMDGQFRKLSRHSILGPNGLHGQWHPPIVDTGVKYPINFDLTPIEIPSLCQPVEDEITTQKDSCKSEAQKSMLESGLSLNEDSKSSVHAAEPCPTVSPDMTEAPVQIDIIRQPSPPPVLADVHDLVPIASTQVTDLTSGPEKLLQDELVRSESPLQLHIANPDAKVLRTKPLHFPKEVAILFGGTMATGEAAWTPAFGTIPDDMPRMPSENHNLSFASNPMSPQSSNFQVEDQEIGLEDQLEEVRRKSPCPSPFKKKKSPCPSRHKKNSGNDALVISIDNLVSSIDSTFKTDSPTIAECIASLKKFPNVPDRLYIYALNAFRTKENREVWMLEDDDRIRMMWLKANADGGFVA